MLAIRLQRTGRKGHAQFRMIVQDARRAPSSGRVIATLGNYNPHTKEVAIDKEKATTYLKNGAQPSDRVARILKADGVTLPSWVNIIKKAEKATKNPEKLRKNRPAEETPAEDASETVTAEVAASEEAATTPAEDASNEETQHTNDTASEAPETAEEKA